MGPISWLFGIIVFVLDIWAIVQIMQSSAETLHKILWVLLILILPFVGLVIWYFAGPRGRAYP